MRDPIQPEARPEVAGSWLVPIAFTVAAPAALCIGLCTPALAAAEAAAPGPAWSWKASPSDPFEQLRADATLGDARASSELARRLLDRFEAGGSRSDLREAVGWIARDWDAQSLVWHGTAGRVVVQHCERRALHLHWLCYEDD